MLKLPEIAQLKRHEQGTLSGSVFSSLKLASINYKPEFLELSGVGQQFGVNADEFEDVQTEAVSIHPNGYKMVNYALLGISHHIQ